MEVPINYLAVLACGVSAMVLGFLWYGPVFGKAWMKELGMTMPGEEEMKAMQGKMMKSYALMFVGAIIMAFTLAHNVVFGSAYLAMSGAEAGLQAGFWNWFGFVVPVLMGAVLWEKKTWKAFFINIGYYLVLLLIMGVILSLWV